SRRSRPIRPVRKREIIPYARETRDATMTPERWQQVKDIFDRAVECTTASRTAYIRDRCGDDEELRREVESLLASDTQTGSLLDNPLMETLADESATSPATNDSFGPYVPIRVLGEGGMGTVYLARQL